MVTVTKRIDIEVLKEVYIGMIGNITLMSGFDCKYLPDRFGRMHILESHIPKKATFAPHFL
jgi:hypothetical protein